MPNEMTRSNELRDEVLPYLDDQTRHENNISYNDTTQRYFWRINGHNLTQSEIAEIAQGQSIRISREFLNSPPELLPISASTLEELAINFNPQSGNYFWRNNSNYLNSQELQQVRSIENARRAAIREQTYSATAIIRGGTRLRSENFSETIPDFIQIDEQLVPFPIGTIVKWNLEIPGVKDHLRSREINNDETYMVKDITTDGDLRLLLPRGCVEEDSLGVGSKYFLKCNAREIKAFNEEQASLKPLIEPPPIGKIIEYIGTDRKQYKRRMLVIGDASKNRVLLTPTNNNISGMGKGKYSFNVWQFAKNQRDSFVPNEEEYRKCQQCHSKRHFNNILIVDTVSFCDADCAQESGLIRCSRCGNFHSSEMSLRTNDGNICRKCMPLYHVCIECEQFFHGDRLHLSPDGSTYICTGCLNQRGRIIFDYSYKPQPRFQKMVYENTRYLGVELEIEMNEERIDKTVFASQIKDWLKSDDNNGKGIEKFIYFKNDGSLHNGFEIVFHPFTLLSFHNKFPLREFLKYIEEMGATTKSGRCGMHVHVSKEKVSDKSLLNGKWFFYKCRPFLKKLSNRREFNFCRFEDYEPTKNPYDQQYGRKTAFNVAGSTKTLELRLFNGTLNHQNFLTNIQFSDCFVAYIQNVGATFLRTATPHQIWGSFLDFAKKNHQYQVMVNHISKNKII